MSFFSLSTSNEDLPRQTTPGKRNIALAPPPGAQEAAYRPTPCHTCSQKTAHNVCQWIGYRSEFGEGRNSHLDLDVRITPEKLRRNQNARFLAHMAFHGYPINAPYNAGGGGNNATQAIGYEVLSGVGNILTLRGPNPKRVNVGDLRENPNWPLGADPETGQLGRLVGDSVAASIPSGACVVFNAPSCLAGKVKPIIKKVNAPTSTALDDVTFTVEVSCNVSNAKVHADPNASGGKFFCTIQWELLLPAAMIDPQDYEETLWTLRVMEFTAASEFNLKNSENGDTRIIYPGMVAPAQELFPEGPITLTLIDGAGNETAVASSAITSRLQTTQLGNGVWETALDLSGLTFAKAVLRFWCEATASDRLLVPALGGCIHAKHDPSNSYNISGGRYCGNVDQATQFGSFEATCWQPECAGFSNDSSQIPSVFSAQHATAWWVAASWLLQQGNPGISASRNFKLIRPSGGTWSLGSILGGLQNTVPIEFEAYTIEYQPPLAGQLITWTDSGGHQQAIIARGAFWREALAQQPDGGPDLRQSTATPTAGLLEASLRLPEKPGGFEYIGHTTVGGSWATGGAGEKIAPIKWSNTETWAVGISRGSVNDDVFSELEALLDAIT